MWKVDTAFLCDINRHTTEVWQSKRHISQNPNKCKNTTQTPIQCHQDTKETVSHCDTQCDQVSPEVIRVSLEPYSSWCRLTQHNRSNILGHTNFTLFFDFWVAIFFSRSFFVEWEYLFCLSLDHILEVHVFVWI